MTPSIPASPAEQSCNTAPKLARALVVDDVDINREMFRMHLACAVQQIDEAADGMAALALFRQRRYDAILLDIEMPGLNGYDTLSAMRNWEQQQKLTATLIVAVTSSDFPGDRQRILAAGASAYLTKPLKQKDLLAALQGSPAASPAPHPMASLFPKVFMYAEVILDELEALGESDAIAEKLHQFRGMMAVCGFEDFAARLKQIHAPLLSDEQAKKPLLAQLRAELHDLKNDSAKYHPDNN